MKHRFVGIVVLASWAAAAGAGAAAWRVPPAGAHPRLVFSAADLPALRARLSDPRGARLFDAVRASADGWVMSPSGEVEKTIRDLERQAADAARTGTPVKIPMHGPAQSALLAAENAALVFAVAGEEAYGRRACEALLALLPHNRSEGLRSAALIYDWCHALLSESERSRVRAGIALLAEEKREQILKAPWSLGPCPVNQAIYWGVYEAGFLGIAAMAMEGEPGYRAEWREIADRCADRSLNRFLDEAGYHENGPAYVGFGFSTFNFYLEARRLRGTDWARHPRLSRMPLWYTYLILPGSIGVAPRTVPVGNSNFGTTTGQDAFMWLAHAMPGNPWARLSLDHVMAPARFNAYYRTLGAQFLWDLPAAPLPDMGRLPKTKWFPDGGVFMRSGWNAQDFVFWLKTQQHRCTTGKHDDYGSFYLHAYGETFATEGAGKVESSGAHNVVFIDGRSMDRASYDVMPSAPLLDLAAGPFASAAVVDQREAYSEDIFFEGDDRRMVSKPLNPVRTARRVACTVWGGRRAGPYFLVVDDIDKDGQPHAYRWQMMTNPAHTVSLLSDRARIGRETALSDVWTPATMDCVSLGPGVEMRAAEETDGKSGRKTVRLFAETRTVNPRFTFCLYPRVPDQPGAWGMPELVRQLVAGEGGHAALLFWPECADRVVVSHGGMAEMAGIRTDAQLVVVRTLRPPAGSRVPFGMPAGLLMVGGTTLRVDGKPYVESSRGACSVSVDLETGTVALGRTPAARARGGVSFGFPVKRLIRYDGERDGTAAKFDG